MLVRIVIKGVPSSDWGFQGRHNWSRTKEFLFNTTGSFGIEVADVVENDFALQVSIIQ